MRLFEPEERPLYYKRSATAWRNKCLTLSVEQEGFLCRVIEFMWDVGHCVPDTNDGAVMLRMNVLKFRKLVSELVATGHLTRGQGHIFNTRALREIEEWNKARVDRARAAVAREFEKVQRRKKAVAHGVNQQPYGEQLGGNPDPTPTQPRPNYTSTQGVGVELGSSSPEVSSKNINKINNTEPDACSNLHIERERKEKEKEKEEEQTSIHTDSLVSVGARADAIEDSVDPKVIGAIRRLKTLIADDDEAHRIVEQRLREFAPEDWRDGVDDLARNRRTGTERRFIDESVVLAYVRRAEQNRIRATIPETVDKPPPKGLEPGVVGDGIEITADRKIALSNGVRQEWLKRFGGNEDMLDLTLTEALGKIRVNSPTSVAHQVTSIMAQACRERLSRQENTIIAVDRQAERRTPRPPTVAGGAEKTETEAERMKRYVAEAFSKGGQ